MALIVVMVIGCSLFAIAYEMAGVGPKEDREVAAAIERLFERKNSQ